MSNAPNVLINETDASFSITREASGIYAVVGAFPRGPIFDPSEVFVSFERFKKVYGDLPSSTASPYYSAIHQVKRALDGGASLRVVRVEEANSYESDWADELVAEKANFAYLHDITLTEELVASNTINLEVLGQALSPTSFDSSSLNTLRLIVNKIKLVPGVLDAFAVSGTVFRVLFGDNGTNITDWAVTGGAAQAEIDDYSVHGPGVINTDHELLYSFEPIAPGAAYNNLTVAVTPTPELGANTHSLVITLGNIRESYSGIKPVIGEALELSFLRAVELNSTLVKPVYNEISTTNMEVLTLTYKFAGGTDGEPDNASYAGLAEGKTGLYSLDEYDDFTDVVILDNHSSDLIASIKSYASNRKDITLGFGLDLLATESTAIETERNTGDPHNS